MTGILLATALPNRRFLFWRAGVRLAAALVVAIATILWMTYAATSSPTRWLIGTSLLLALTVALLLAGVLPLRFLTRRFELYEDGFEVHDEQVQVVQIVRLIWERKLFYLFGCIPTQHSYLTLTCLLQPESPKHKKGRTLHYSELFYLNLYDCFEEAYEQSIPATYSLTLRPLAPSKATPTKATTPPQE